MESLVTVYVGVPGDPARVVVWSVSPQGSSLCYQLRHVVRHSPTGLEWGYGGSGPADLALSLVADAVGRQRARCEGCADLWESERSRCVACGGSGLSGLVEASYQRVKWELVAGLPQDRWWVLTDQQVVDVAAQAWEPAACAGDS